MDTVIRGKPIPKFFIRQKLNVTTKTSVREVVDGQQRMRTPLSFVRDGFVISRSQNSEFGGKRFSQLPEDTQEQVLSYELAVDLLINLPDSEILDIFSRLNSYAVILNEQEKLNAQFFGPFKISADRIGRKYTDYWKHNTILTAQQILRMGEVNLVADLLIAMIEGLKAKKRIKGAYKSYELRFEHDVDELETKFDMCMGVVQATFPSGLKGLEFSRPYMFYSLFTAVYHCLYGLKGMTAPQVRLTTQNEVASARSSLEYVDELFSADSGNQFSAEERAFRIASTRATTDQSSRETRTKYLLSLLAWPLPVAAALAEFNASVAQCQSLIANAHGLEPVSGNHLLPEIDRQQITVAAFLNMFIAWETFLEATMAALLSGSPTINGANPVTYASPASPAAARSMIIGTHRYFDYANHQNFTKMVGIYFEDGKPFQPHLAAIYSKLEDLRTMRNASAHVTSTTQTGLEALASRLLGHQSPGIRLYDLLTANDPSTPLGDTILKTYQDTLLVTASLIANG